MRVGVFSDSVLNFVITDKLFKEVSDIRRRMSVASFSCIEASLSKVQEK